MGNHCKVFIYEETEYDTCFRCIALAVILRVIFKMAKLEARGPVRKLICMVQVRHNGALGQVARVDMEWI